MMDLTDVLCSMKNVKIARQRHREAVGTSEVEWCWPRPKVTLPLALVNSLSPF